jgi:cellobiose phosphorylase
VRYYPPLDIVQTIKDSAAMADARNDSAGVRLESASGLRAEINANGSLRRLDCGSVSVLLFIGNELEGGPANLFLRQRQAPEAWTPLLGPRSPTRYAQRAPGSWTGTGVWRQTEYSIALLLAADAPVWFWQVRLINRSARALEVDLTYAQDLALAPYGAVRMNEFYVSQYVDHMPLPDSRHGLLVASRQNQAVDGRYPWSLLGSLRTGAAFGTDALQLHGLATRSGEAPAALSGRLPDTRLQHEHSMVVIRDQPLRLEPGRRMAAGFFGATLADHPQATSEADLARLSEWIALPEASLQTEGEAVSAMPATNLATSSSASLFSSAPLLQATDLDAASLKALFGSQWRHVERDRNDSLLSFFHGRDRHVVLRAKERQVLRPHGHILRSGRHLTPDETGLTSTAWMSGVFHSMLTQGHVSINRVFSTMHSYLGLLQSQGVRIFAEIGGQWRLLQLPSAFELSPQACRWIYRFDEGEIQVRSEASEDPREMLLAVEVSRGAPLRLLLSHHVALNDDDGSRPGAALWRREADAVLLQAVPDSEVGRRFPHGLFEIQPVATQFERVGGDELLFEDGQSRGQPYLCLRLGPTRSAALRYIGRLITVSSPPPLAAAATQELIPAPRLEAPAASPLAESVARLASAVPWFAHNALVHYLSPRGLEQYSGGGWGTRDVCQGPVEMLLALERTQPVRDLLLRVFAMQNPDGDWPQWFMFFERERGIRAGDSHGDIVFWPLLVLAQYLIAAGDAALLEQRVPFFDARAADAGEQATIWQHAQRALVLVARRVIPGTALAAYGHGDWNDALQPADPHLREHMCSAWTVTLHHQMLTLLAQALRASGKPDEAAGLDDSAAAVLRDFRRLLLVDDVLTGYVVFEEGGGVRYLLHPRDDTTGVHYSSLAIVHAILEDLLTPEQARQHLDLIDQHLKGPDGLRLFDRPLPYHGGPQRLFQRAESATFFGREIGLMYMHLHLRYAPALAHVGEAQKFFEALCQANPIGIQSVVTSATLRQANCYYSSSDAAFADRYQASAQYDRVGRGAVALDGGWRVYSSGAGISLGLILRRFIGVSIEAAATCFDPVVPPALDGLRFETTLYGRPLELQYRVGARGCGVQTLLLNGRALAFTQDPNPHRPGAARVPRAALNERLVAAGNVLEIGIG